MDELSVSEGKYRRLFEGAFLGIFQSTPEGKLLRINPAFAEAFGYDSPAELIQSVSDLAEDLYADPEQFKRNAKQAILQKTAVNVEAHFRRKDGTTFLAKLRKWAVENGGDDPPYLEGYIEEIEEQKRM